MAIYILLTQQLVGDLGGDPERQVSKTAMLIAPKNVGLTPALEKQDVAARVKRAGTLLGRDIPVKDLAAGLPSGVFGEIADQSIEPQRRLAIFANLVDRVGSTFHPACLSTCGAARFCRAARIANGDPIIAGNQAVRLMPGVRSLPRAVELAHGADPSTTEAAAAGQLERANRLYERAVTSREPVGVLR